MSQCLKSQIDPWFKTKKNYNVFKGIQEFRVPKTSDYKITANGAQGGCEGGYGAQISGVFQLQENQIIKIAVGQMGTTGRTWRDEEWDSFYNGGGGAGGSFVIRFSEKFYKNSEILVIAGGGGGGNRKSIFGTIGPNNRTNGRVEESGASTRIDDQIEDGGGTNGQGGRNGMWYTYHGAGGAGFYSNGESGTGLRHDDGPGCQPTGGHGWFNVTPLIGGKEGNYAGAKIKYLRSNGGDGGFGGGGAGYGSGGVASGGGGGYSGGQGSEGYTNGRNGGFGGGGGSYLSKLARNAVKFEGKNQGHGSVIIEILE